MVLHSTHVPLVSSKQFYHVVCSLQSKSDTWARALNNHFHDKFPDKYPFRTKEKVGDKMRS